MAADIVGDVDTGPGLEAHVSWDYSHSTGMADALAGYQARQALNKLQTQRNPNSASLGPGEAILIAPNSCTGVKED